MYLLDLKKEILKERDSGKSIIDMSKLFNIDVCTLFTLLKNNDIAIENNEIKAIINYLNSEIAAYRMSKDKVNALKTIEKINFIKEFLNFKNTESKRKDANNIYKILSLREEGYTIERISMIMRMSPTTIKEILKMYSNPLHSLYKGGTKLKFIDINKFHEQNKSKIEEIIKKEYIGDECYSVVYVLNNVNNVIEEIERFLKSNLKKELIVSKELTIYIVNGKDISETLVEVAYKKIGKRRSIYQKYVIIKRAMRYIRTLELTE